MEEITTLVFEGGSVKGLVYVGALQVLDNYYKDKKGKPFLAGVERVAGTSAGSIMALLVALGLGLEEINTVMQTTSFASFADMSWYAFGYSGKGAAIYRNGYLCEGLVFMNWVKGLLEKYAQNKEITFKQLRDKTKKDFHVYAVRLNDGKVISFNADQTPDVSIALALRMSMSIPIFFKPVRVDEHYNEKGELVNVTLNEKNGKSYYVDGGVKANYPYQELKKNNKNLKDEQILGFKVDSRKEIFSTACAQGAGKYLAPLERKQNEIKYSYGINLIPYIFNAMTSPQEDAHRADPLAYSRTIYCWDCDVSTFDFKLNEKQIDGLLASGMSAAHSFIEKAAKEKTPPINEEHLEKQVKSAKVLTSPEPKQIEFTKEYKQLEARRVKPIWEAVEKNIKSSKSVEPEQKEYVESLAADVKKITSSIVIRGKAGDIDQTIACVTDINPEDFDKASAYVLKLVEEGLDIKIEVDSNAAAGNITSDIASLTFHTGFFATVNKNAELMSKAENALEQFDKNKTLYDTRAIKRVSNELDELLKKVKEDKALVAKNRVSIEALESSPKEIMLKTNELKKLMAERDREQQETLKGAPKPKQPAENKTYCQKKESS